MATDINALYQSTLGRSADKAGLDYWSNIAKTKGIDAVKHGLAASDEARKYKSTGTAATVKASDRVSGLSYRSPSRSSSSSTSSSSGNNVSKQLNDIYQSTLGRSLDKSGMDYWSGIANEQGIDAVRRHIGASDEARLYQQRGTGLTVSALDQVDGFSYRNNADIASQQARDQADYGLLQSAMNKAVENGNFTTVQDEQGNTLYRSSTGGLYNIAGQPVQERPTLRAPQTTVSRNQTAAGQLDDMLASNSPLMQRAAMQGRQYANARGLLNSSMASEAAQGAMIDRATPFALQDAQTYFQNSQANADRQQQAYMANLNYQNQLGLNEQQYGFQRGLNEQGYGFDMGRMQQQFNNEMQRMGYAYELDQRNVPQNYAANISAQTLQNVQAIQADPNLEPAAKQAAIKNAIDMANANLTWAEVFYNTPMPALRTPGAA